MNARVLIVGVLLCLLALVAAGLAFTGPFATPAGRGIFLGGAAIVLAAAVVALVSQRWLGPLLVSTGTIAAAALAWGVVAGDAVAGSAGVVGLVVALAAVAVTFQIVESRGPSEGVKAEAAPAQTDELLRRIHDHTMLSESAKRVLFRERELDLLRGAIEDDIRRGDYNAALRLCDDMADLFGYRQEAETFRARLDESRRADADAQVAAALEQLDTMLQDRNWAAAHDIAARMRRLFPDSHHVIDIDTRIERARDEHKRELEDAFLEAARREDVELAMERLRELDRYLDRDEAERIEEVAKEIVAKHRDNLSVQFKLAVNGHDWKVAARIGESIMHEFPNSRMAEEVRSMIDVIRTRASQAAVAGGSEGS